MNLDEAIKHCEDKAKELRKEKRRMAVIGREREWVDCLQCAEEHEQLAEWLKDYKRLKAVRPICPVDFPTEDDPYPVCPHEQEAENEQTTD